MSKLRNSASLSNQRMLSGQSVPGWLVILMLPLCLGMAMGCYCLTRLKFVEAIFATLAGVVCFGLPFCGFLLPAMVASYRRLACSVAIFVFNFALLIPLTQHSMIGIVAAGVGWLCLTTYSVRSQNRRDSNLLLNQASLMIPGPETSGDS
jgi:hypothetical protein